MWRCQCLQIVLPRRGRDPDGGADRCDRSIHCRSAAGPLPNQLAGRRQPEVRRNKGWKAIPRQRDAPAVPLGATYRRAQLDCRDPEIALQRLYGRGSPKSLTDVLYRGRPQAETLAQEVRAFAGRACLPAADQLALYTFIFASEGGERAQLCGAFVVHERAPVDSGRHGRAADWRRACS